MTRITLTVLVFLGLLTACSIQISDSTATLPVTAAPTPNHVPQTPNVAPTLLPPAWSHLNLSGRLLFTQGKLGVGELDLATGAISSVFVPPTNGWLVGAATSPDGQTVALAYGPPPPEGKVQLGYTDLYLISADGSALPAPRLERTQVAESYFSPIWSPDGKYLYYVHFAGLPDTLNPPPELPYKYTLERLPDPTSADTPPEVILESAIWPAISPDGTKLAYVAVDLANYQNDLYLANADGSGALSLLPPGTFQAIDSPLFSPDGSAIIFSAVGEGPQSEAEGSSLSWLDRLLGVQAASAHNVPSDWWRVPVAGGPPERLTKIYDTGLYGDFAPDGQHIAYLSVTGLYVMTPDGKEVTALANLSVFGTLEWIQ